MNGKSMEENIFDPALKWPSILNSGEKYFECLQKLNTLEKFSCFMEDTLIMNTLHLTDNELKNMIKKISEDLIELNHVSIPPISIQQWVVDFFTSWDSVISESKETETKNKNEKNPMHKVQSSKCNSSSSNSSSSVSDTTNTTETEETDVEEKEENINTELEGDSSEPSLSFSDISSTDDSDDIM